VEQLAGESQSGLSPDCNAKDILGDWPQQREPAMDNPREQRGLVIAALSRIKKTGSLWSVPSQDTTKCGRRYSVDPTACTCTCPDHLEAGQKCKHIFAVEYTIEREYSEGGVVLTEKESLTVQTTRKTYSQDWRNYNLAQTNEKAKFQMLLRGLCDGIAVPKQLGRGCRRIPLDDAIFSAVFKVYSTQSGRRFMCDLCDSHAKGYIKRLPCYNSIFNVLESEGTTEVLVSLIIESANPLKAIETNFAVDSTGFSGNRFDKWFDKKWGELKTKRAWVKAHIMTGVRTNVVTAVKVLEENSSDTVNFKPLLNCTAERFSMDNVSADLAYSNEANIQAVVATGAYPLIPFKRNATGATKGELWAKMFHYFSFNRDEFLARYHQRSNVESTFSMIKAKFGDSVRSKTDTAMRNEALAKILCHNVCCLISAMYELRIEPEFWKPGQLAG
jgi:transposase